MRVPILAFLVAALLPAQWLTSTPEAEGLDSRLLEQASQFLEQGNPVRYSFLVVRHDRLVFERYYHGSSAADANNIKSMSKSILSTLMGIAIDEGLVSGPGERLAAFFPEYFRAGDDARKRDLTLEHLLTMTAGFRWEENSTISDECFSSDNWHRWVIESPLTDIPGEHFNYSTGLTHLGSGILTRRSGLSTRAYAQTRLFSPLGILCYRWTQDPQGYNFGGSEVWLTARDLAKFGLLVAHDGVWEGRRIVSGDWIRRSTQLRIRTGNSLGDYAYWWWKYTLNGYPTTLASGFGAQNIFVVPELDLVMVTTARSNVEDNIADRYAQPYDALSRYVIPAVIADPPKATAVVDAMDGGSQLRPGGYGTVFGSSLSIATESSDAVMPADGRLPEAIAGVRILLGGRRVWPSYVSPGQVNFYIAPDHPSGAQTLVLTTPRGSSSIAAEVAQ